MERLRAVLPLTKLEDMVSMMVLPDEPADSAWQKVFADGSLAEPQTIEGDLLKAREKSNYAIVVYVFPGNALAKQNNKMQDVQGLLAKQSDQKPIFVSSLPTIFVEEIRFPTESSKRNFESNQQRLLANRGSWITTSLLSDSDIMWLDTQLHEDRTSVVDGDGDARSLEKIAATVATWIKRSATILGPTASISFDPDSVALMRMMLHGSIELPEQSLVSKDCNHLATLFRRAAKEKRIKTPVIPRKWSFAKYGCLQIGTLFRQDKTDDDLFDKEPTSEEEVEGVDQRFFAYLLQELTRLEQSPGLTDLRKVLEGAREALGLQDLSDAIAGEQESEARKFSFGLDQLLQNIEHSVASVDEFSIEHKGYPALRAAALVFWSWSKTNFDKNFRGRLSTLGNDSSDIARIAKVIHISATGTESFSDKKLSDPFWREAYKLAWASLLSGGSASSTTPKPKDTWIQEKVGVTETDDGWTITLNLERLPTMSLDILEPVERLVRRILRCAKMPSLQKQLLDIFLKSYNRATHDLPPTLRRQVAHNLRIRVSFPDRSDGTYRHYDNISESDYSLDACWKNPTPVLEFLGDENGVRRLCSKLPKEQLDDLSTQVSMLDSTDAGIGSIIGDTEGRYDVGRKGI